jgi:transcriptional regulator with XRE-family HTH domain
MSQIELAGLAGVSHGTVSLVERGHSDRLSLRAVRGIAAALDVRVEMLARWRGGELDRLLSRRHSALGESFAGFLLGQLGWVVDPEVSFSLYGERGMVDLLAWHAATSHVVVIELKTEFVDINEMLGTLDRKRRLARSIAAARGWRPVLVSVWLIIEDSHTNRRHAAEHRTLLRAALPLDGRHLRPFLARPVEATLGMAFWPSANARSSGSGPRRNDGSVVARGRRPNASPSVDRSSTADRAGGIPAPKPGWGP